MNKRIVLIFLLLTVGTAAQPAGKTNSQKIKVKWSERMANTILTRSDSLIYYVDRNPKWAYDVAFLGMAIDRLGKSNSRYSEYMENWVDHFVKPDGSVLDYNSNEYNLDRIFPGRNVFTLYKRKPELKYKVALDNFITQLKTHPKTKSGGYWHKKIYPWQMWLDGIFMASPFMAEYAKEFNEPEWFDAACTQTKLIYEKTIDPASGLLMHAWDESQSQKWCDSATGKSHYPWSRSMGWYIMAIEDILEYLPANHPDRASLINILQKTCESLLKVRDQKTGLWFQVLNCGGKEGNYIEGSGSAMYVYAFARGVHKGYLDKKFLDIADKSFNGIIKNLITVDKDGLLTMHNICGGCGLGGNPYRDGSYEYYITEKRVDNDPKGVAPFILAALELDK
jgi:unsaturated rhamnogalacturonyl hydrolase